MSKKKPAKKSAAKKYDACKALRQSLRALLSEEKIGTAAETRAYVLEELQIAELEHTRKELSKRPDVIAYNAAGLALEELDILPKRGELVIGYLGDAGVA